MLQGLGQLVTFCAVQVGHLRVQQRRRRVGGCQVAFSSSRRAAFAIISSFTSAAGTPSIIISTSFLRRASMRSISRSAADRLGAVLHPQPVHLARELVAELLEQLLTQQLLLSASSTRASTSSRRMVRWLSHVPWSRAPKHPSRFFDAMMNPAPQTPHFVSPENRYCGRLRWLSRAAR